MAERLPISGVEGLIVVLSWPEDGQSRPKRSQILPNRNYCILFDVCCVLTVHNILHKFDYTQRDGLSQIRNMRTINIRELCLPP